MRGVPAHGEIVVLANIAGLGKIAQWDSDRSNGTRQIRKYPTAHLVPAELRISGSGRSLIMCARPALTTGRSKSGTIV